jgi:sodium-dependent dicarboxylate transporter 2/3/5
VSPQPDNTASTNEALKLFLRILAGPLAFFVVQTLSLPGLEAGPHFALSCYAWVVAWWATMPIPWAITGFLPLVLFPLGGVMPFRDVAALYGQRVFPFLLGIMLFGHAFRKYGLAKRMAMNVLSIPGVATSGARLILMVIVVTAVLSALVDDAAAVAIMIPIALSVARFASDTTSAKTPRLMEASCLAVLYGSAAGGMATPAGVPFNPLAISLLDQLTEYQISFTQWTLTGVILAVATIPVYYLILLFMSPPEVHTIPDGAAYFAEAKKALGPMSRGEKNVLFVLIVMIVLWFLPAVVTISFLDIWFVPPVAMVLLFLLPVDARKGEMTLGSKDVQEGVLWNILFLVVSGSAIASGLASLGITDWIGRMISAGASAAVLPWLAGLVTPILSHLTSGTATTAMVSTVLFPIANDLGYNAAILARIIAGTALAVSFPWSGAGAGTAFASGAISFGGMFRIGVVATILTMIVITVLSIVLVPALGAFTMP